MNEFKFKLYLALRDNKLLAVRDLFVLSYDVRNNRYNIWFITGNGKLRLYESVESSLITKFKWNILMNGGSECLS